MRQINPEFVYYISELSESSRLNALRNLRDRRETDMMDVTVDEMLKSVKAFAESFGYEFVNYEVYFYSPVRFDLKDTSFDANSIDDLVAKINNNWPDEVNGACSLTGNYTDCYIYDHFKNIGGTSASTFLNDIEDAIRYAVNTFLTELEKELDSEKSAMDYALESGLEFYEDGELAIIYR